MTRSVWIKLATAWLALMTLVPAADAAGLTFSMRNDHPNAVEVELYSQNRRHVWPGGGDVYILDDGETKQIAISCQRGEKICYGAWVSGDSTTYWGTGPNNGHHCSNCCFTCNGTVTREINLTE
nr:hypothetical protein [uncultured Gellertiella sp.]